MTGFWETAAELDRAGSDFVVVTLVGTRGHAPQDPGAKAIIAGDGLRFGTVGGGKIEAHCIRESHRILAGESPPNELHTWNLQRDIGMTCGGEVTILFERHRPTAWPIVVFGAGHVAQALARVLETLACRATFVDNRPEWLDRLPKSPKLRPVLVAEPVDYVEKLRGDEFCVVMTRGHASDLPVLKAIFSRTEFPAYVGCMGSDVKALKLRNELKTFGEGRTGFGMRLAEFHCPIGLEFGSNDPAEIALSVASQLVQERDRTRKIRR